MVAGSQPTNVATSKPATETAAQNITFPASDAEKTDFNKAIFEITPFTVKFTLPDGWTIGEFDASTAPYLYSGVWSRMGIYDAEKNCVGAVGYNIAESIAYTE